MRKLMSAKTAGLVCIGDRLVEVNGIGVGAIRHRVIDADRLAFIHRIVVDDAVFVTRVLDGIQIAIHHGESAAFSILVRGSQNGVDVRQLITLSVYFPVVGVAFHLHLRAGAEGLGGDPGVQGGFFRIGIERAGVAPAITSILVEQSHPVCHSAIFLHKLVHVGIIFLVELHQVMLRIHGKLAALPLGQNVQEGTVRLWPGDFEGVIVQFRKLHVRTLTGRNPVRRHTVRVEIRVTQHILDVERNVIGGEGLLHPTTSCPCACGRCIPLRQG